MVLLIGEKDGDEWVNEEVKVNGEEEEGEEEEGNSEDCCGRNGVEDCGDVDEGREDGGAG